MPTTQMAVMKTVGTGVTQNPGKNQNWKSKGIKSVVQVPLVVVFW